MLKLMIVSMFLVTVSAENPDVFLGLNESGADALVPGSAEASVTVTALAPIAYRQTDTTEDSPSVYRWAHKSVVRVEQEIATINAGVNLRTIPLNGTQERPHRVSQRAQFPVLGIEDGWYKVDVTTVYPDLQLAKFKIATVNTDSSSLALRPAINSSTRSVRAWMPKDSRVQILETRGNWALVKFQAQSGYASTRYLKETGEEEEFWHRHLDVQSGAEFLELDSLRDQVNSTDTTVAATTILRFITVLDESMPRMKLYELNSAVLEMERQVGIALARGTSSEAAENTALTAIRRFLEERVNRIEKEQTEAKKLLDEGNLDSALVYAQIGAYKTRYAHRENLQLLHEILKRKIAVETDPQTKTNLNEQAEFVQRVISASQEIEPPSVDFTESGAEGSVDGGLPAQQEIDELLVVAKELNSRNQYAQALDLGLSLLERTEGKSVKVKAFVGVQLLHMAALPEFSEQAEGYRSRASLYLAEAREGVTANLTEYPDNREWESKLNELSVPGENTEEIEPTEVEQAIDVVIDDVIDKNRIHYYTNGKNRLEELDRQHEGKSAKIKFQIAEQCLHLARVNRGQASVWLTRASEYLSSAEALRGQHLQTFTENSLWADRALNRRRELVSGEGGQLSAPAPETQEAGSESLAPAQEGNKHLVITNFDMNVLTTLAILEAGASCLEEWLDVAQVVFNRIHSPLYNQNTVSQVAFASGQFEPFFSILGRQNSTLRSRIFATQNESAAFASRKRRGLSVSMANNRINDMKNQLQDESKMRAARDFVGGRSFFLGANMSFSEARGDVRRRRGCNHYKIGIRMADVNRHRRHMPSLVEKAPLKVTSR